MRIEAFIGFQITMLENLAHGRLNCWQQPSCAIIRRMEKIATSTYSFEKLRKAGYVYVDKTDLLWRRVPCRATGSVLLSRRW